MQLKQQCTVLLECAPVSLDFMSGVMSMYKQVDKKKLALRASVFPIVLTIKTEKKTKTKKKQVK